MFLGRAVLMLKTCIGLWNQESIKELNFINNDALSIPISRHKQFAFESQNWTKSDRNHEFMEKHQPWFQATLYIMERTHFVQTDTFTSDTNSSFRSFRCLWRSILKWSVPSEAGAPLPPCSSSLPSRSRPVKRTRRAHPLHNVSIQAGEMWLVTLSWSVTRYLEITAPEWLWGRGIQGVEDYSQPITLRTGSTQPTLRSHTLTLTRRRQMIQWWYSTEGREHTIDPKHQGNICGHGRADCCGFIDTLICEVEFV